MEPWAWRALHSGQFAQARSLAFNGSFSACAQRHASARGAVVLPVRGIEEAFQGGVARARSVVLRIARQSARRHACGGIGNAARLARSRTEPQAHIAEAPPHKAGTDLDAVGAGRALRVLATGAAFAADWTVLACRRAGARATGGAYRDLCDRFTLGVNAVGGDTALPADAVPAVLQGSGQRQAPFRQTLPPRQSPSAQH
jgi:hypothetical protein